MKLTVNIYKVVQFVDSETRRLDKKFPNKLRNENKRIVPKKGDLLKAYSRKHPDVDYERISENFDSAVDNDYLRMNDKALVTINPVKGRDLLEGWRFFPWGLIREIWNRDSKLIIAIWGLVGGFLVRELITRIF